MLVYVRWQSIAPCPGYFARFFARGPICRSFVLRAERAPLRRSLKLHL